MTGEEIRELRKRLSWSQQHFAEMLGVSTVSVSRWEQGRAKPSAIAQRLLKDLAEKKGGETSLREKIKQVENLIGQQIGSEKYSKAKAKHLTEGIRMILEKE